MDVLSDVVTSCMASKVVGTLTQPFQAGLSDLRINMQEKLTIFLKNVESCPNTSYANMQTLPFRMPGRAQQIPNILDVVAGISNCSNYSPNEF